MIRNDIKNIKSSKRDLRNFGLTVGGAFIVLSALLWWFESGAWKILIFIGAVLLAFGVTAPIVLKPFQKLWMSAAIVMGWVMTHLILTVFFYVALLPLGLV